MWNVKSGKWNYCAACNKDKIFVVCGESINFTFHFTLFTLINNFRFFNLFVSLTDLSSCL